MKKVLFLMLAMVVGITAASAQQKVAYKKGDMFKASVTTSLPELVGKDAPAAMNFAPSEVITRAPRHNNFREGFEDFETMVTLYDLQSNSMVGNRIAVWPDGTAAVTATWSADESPYNTRGTGYNYYDGSDFGDLPEARVEDAKRGWPSIAACGDGELLTSHGDGVFMYKRDTKGEGDWTEIHHFRDYNYHNLASDAGAWTWARVATSGNGQYVHVLLADQQTIGGNNRSIVSYIRSTDGGQTFSDPADPPLIDIENEYLLDISADDYMIATNGDKVAILFCSMTFDLFYLYSEDNGETWTKQVVWNFRGEDHAWDWGRTDVSSATDSIWSPDNSASIAIGDDGTVHVAFALFRWAPAPDSGWGYYSYWPFTDGIVYWNSNYTNEQGGHNIPDFGQWSGDADLMVQMGNNGVNGISSTLNDERIYALAEADGFQNLNLITPDEDHDGQLGYTSELWDNHWGAYRTQGIATMPSISIDESNRLFIAYSVLSESRTSFTPNSLEFYLRSAIITYRDELGDWYYDAINLSDSYQHSSDEVYPVTAYCKGKDGAFWMYYSADDQFGLLLDFTEGDDAQSTATENSIWAVKVQLDTDGVNEAINPMTAARVYPNPANGILNVEVNASTSSDATVSVFNIMGQKVVEQNTSLYTGINTATINTSELSSGVYFVTVKANNYERTMKFVVK